jgi:hypothetical protein
MGMLPLSAAIAVVPARDFHISAPTYCEPGAVPGGRYGKEEPSFSD